MIRQLLIRSGRGSAGIYPGVIAHYEQSLFGKTAMAIISRLSSIAFSYFQNCFFREMVKGDVVPCDKNRCVSWVAGILFGIASLFMISSVMAATGGGAIVHNTVMASTSDGPVTASVNVTVATLATSPQISVDLTAQTVMSAATVTYNYTLVNTSNGTDNFSVTAASVDAGMDGAPGLDVNSTATPSSSFTLGASIASVASDAAGNVYIPASSEMNLSIGDEIVISGVGVYTIATLNPGTVASTVGTVTTLEIPTQFTVTPIGASPAIGAGVVSVGTQIGERVVFPVVVTANTPAVVGVPGTHTVNLSGLTTDTDAGGVVVNYSTSTGNGNETITTVSDAMVNFVKEVRNVTKGSPFATSGGSLQSGDVLEYRITATPVPGVGNIFNSQVVDEVPTNTTYVAGSTTLNSVAVPDGAGATLPTTAANGGLQINSPIGAAGVLVDGESAVLIFQVAVD